MKGKGKICLLSKILVIGYDMRGQEEFCGFYKFWKLFNNIFHTYHQNHQNIIDRKYCQVTKDGGLSLVASIPYSLDRKVQTKDLFFCRIHGNFSPANFVVWLEQQTLKTRTSTVLQTSHKTWTLPHGVTATSATSWACSAATCFTSPKAARSRSHQLSI